MPIRLPDKCSVAPERQRMDLISRKEKPPSTVSGLYNGVFHWLESAICCSVRRNRYRLYSFRPLAPLERGDFLISGGSMQVEIMREYSHNISMEYSFLCKINSFTFP